LNKAIYIKIILVPTGSNAEYQKISNKNISIKLTIMESKILNSQWTDKRTQWEWIVYTLRNVYDYYYNADAYRYNKLVDFYCLSYILSKTNEWVYNCCLYSLYTIIWSRSYWQFDLTILAHLIFFIAYRIGLLNRINKSAEVLDRLEWIIIKKNHPILEYLPPTSNDSRL